MQYPPLRQRGAGPALAVVVAAYMLSFFHRFAPASIAQDLAVAFQTSAASLGALAAAYFYVYLLMQVPTGILADTFGPRRILLFGGLVAGAGSLLFGLAQGLDAALVGRTLVGLGVSVVFIAMLKIIAVWFEERRFATLVGLAMLAGNLGSVLAGRPLAALAETFGWRSAFVGAGMLSVALGFLCWLLVRDRPDDGEARQRGDRTAVLVGLLSVLRNRATWPPTLVNVGLAGSFFAFAGLWAMPYLTHVHGMSRAAASNHLSLYSAAFALGCLLVGGISDRLGRRKPVLMAAAHLNGALWLVWLSGASLSLAASYALFAAMGLTTAGFVLTWACAKEVNPPLLSGMSTSVANMGAFLGAALLQPLAGWIMDLHWSGALANGARIYAPEDFRWGLTLIAGAAWLGALASWRIRETHCRNVWTSEAS